MKKQRHEVIADFLKTYLPDCKKEAFERRRQTDNVVIWMVGLSTGAIALLFSFSNNISFIHIIALKISLLFLLCTVIAGVIFRSNIYILEQRESNVILGFEGYCHAFSCEINGPIEISEHHTKEDIAKSLKNDMGLDYDEWLKYPYLDRKFWIDHYNRWAEFWRDSEQEGLKRLGRAFAPLLDKDPKDGEDYFLKQQNTSINNQQIKLLRYVCDRAYAYMLICFCLALCTLTISFIIK